jgi:hypothetical protein
MKRSDFKDGSSSFDVFWYWINERHGIYCGLPTDDEILLNWRFTNVFRQLDRGTVAIQSLLNGHDESTIVKNLIVHRLFNWYNTTKAMGVITDPKETASLLFHREAQGEKMVTGAHMTTGQLGCSKTETIVSTMHAIWSYEFLSPPETLKDSFQWLLEFGFFGVGKFIAYEIVCDMRFLIHRPWADALTWANIGPGCRRGLKRLGMPVEIASLRELHARANENLADHVIQHLQGTYPPFELREIEHSLCEFDKYVRTTEGGRPRERYRERKYE